MTPRQIKHLKEELFFTGPIPETRGEASDLIQRLHDDPETEKLRRYNARLGEGPWWLEWEKGCLMSRDDYERAQWVYWWKETRKLAEEVGLPPPEMPDFPER